MANRRPVLTKAILQQFSNNFEFQRFLMDLSGVSTSSNDLLERVEELEKLAIILQSVGDIDNPIELNNVDGSFEGSFLIAYEIGIYTLYCFSEIQITENSPYIVNGDTGSWYAVGGKYINADHNISGVLYTTGRKKNTVEITGVAHNVTINDEVIIGRTDSNAITLNLPPGTNGGFHTIKNTGTSNFDITLNPDGTETIFGETSEVVYDGEVIDIGFNTTIGWF